MQWLEYCLIILMDICVWSFAIALHGFAILSLEKTWVYYTVWQIFFN